MIVPEDARIKIRAEMTRCGYTVESLCQSADISQTVLSEYFAMIMLVDITKLSIGFGDFVDKLRALGDDNGLVISVMHEDIFNSMHRI